MASSLVELLQKSPAVLEDKSYRQIIQFAGEGRLLDGNKTSTEVRAWLASVPLERLRQGAEECLNSPFEGSGHALQDLVNQIGVRLGFSVQHGRYRGVKGENGFDGLWRAKDGHTLLLEVKTTDAYRINLDVIAEYRSALIDSDELGEDNSSILIAVGRQDTGDLEAQIRGSRHAWDVRVISIQALLHLAEVKEQVSDWATSSKINRVLRPMEYTRVDAIVELLFATSRDIENPDPPAPQPATGNEPQEKTPVSTAQLESAREAALTLVAAKIKAPLVRKGRALRSTADGSANVVCLASQRYSGPGGSDNYWYGFTRAQREFLSEARNGWVVLACGDKPRTFLISRDTFCSWLPNLLSTPPEAAIEDVRHWHVYFNDYGNRVEMPQRGGGKNWDLSPYLLT